MLTRTVHRGELQQDRRVSSKEVQLIAVYSILENHQNGVISVFCPTKDKYLRECLGQEDWFSHLTMLVTMFCIWHVNMYMLSVMCMHACIYI